MTQKKRKRLVAMKYDEISLVGKGANQDARIIISKRDDETCEHGNIAKACRGCGASEPSAARQESYDESKHPREEDGTYSETSEESKEKYGKDGTTGSLPDCEECQQKKKEEAAVKKSVCNHKGGKMPTLKVKKNDGGSQTDSAASDDSGDSEEEKPKPTPPPADPAPQKEDGSESDDSDEEETDEDSENAEEMRKSAREPLSAALTLIEVVAKSFDEPDFEEKYEDAINSFNHRMDTVCKRLSSGRAIVTKTNRPSNIHQRISSLIGVPPTRKEVSTVAKSDEGTQEEDIFKGLSPQVAEIVRKSQRVLEENEVEKWDKIAKSYTHVPGDKSDLAKTLRRLSETDPDGYEVMKSTLDAANYNLSQSDIFKSAGRSGAGVTGDKADGLAREMVEKSDGNLTIEQARVKVMELHPEMYTG